MSTLARAQQAPAISALMPMTDGVQPITVEERHARIEYSRRLMASAENRRRLHGTRVVACFTSRVRATFRAVLIPAKGEIVWIVPVAEELTRP